MTKGISIRYLNKSFGGFKLQNINIEIPRGYVTAIIGNNGAGKTSLLKCITGSYIPDSGVVEYGVPKQYGRIGVVFDECPYPPTMRIDALSTLFFMSPVITGFSFCPAISDTSYDIFQSGCFIKAEHYICCLDCLESCALAEIVLSREELYHARVGIENTVDVDIV